VTSQVLVRPATTLPPIDSTRTPDVKRPNFDENGLPLRYEPDSIDVYWRSRPREMASHWAFFLSTTTPFLAKVTRQFSQGKFNEKELARDFRVCVEKLGTTFVKLAQALAMRPDVIPPGAQAELSKLQDAVPPFPSKEAFVCIEEELGRPLSDVFAEISAEPRGSASLAQVYRAKLHNGDVVAVKIQRPGLLPIITRDLYVLKRAVNVYSQLAAKFTKQTTDYLALLETWASAYFDEVDFTMEAENQQRARRLLADVEGVSVPAVYPEFTTRRLLVTEWIEGVPLNSLDSSAISSITPVAQAAFLQLLLEEGFMHGDPHGGNLLKPADSTQHGDLCILDWGLTASINEVQRDAFVSSLVHVSNKDFNSLVDDFAALGVLPPKGVDRGRVIPIMEKIIGPYVFEGGGAKAIKRLNLQSLTADLGRAALEIEFNIPSEFALLARSLGILEGIALAGDPDYKIVLSAYPYVARRLLASDESSPLLRSALQQIVMKDGRVNTRALTNLLAYAAEIPLSEHERNSTFVVDFDAVDGDSAMKVADALLKLLMDGTPQIRSAIVRETSSTGDLLVRRVARDVAGAFRRALTPPPPPLPFLPRLPSLPPPPFFDTILDALAPPLNTQEEILLSSLREAAPVGSELFDVLQRITPSSPEARALQEITQEVSRSMVEKGNSRVQRLLTQAAAVGANR
jgi:aarF domain-containing kinase